VAEPVEAVDVQEEVVPSPPVGEVSSPSDDGGGEESPQTEGEVS
jgi:hypothetical protein